MRRLVEAVRERRGIELGVSITYTDRPSNDFSALFTLLHDAKNTESPQYGNANVYVYACGTSANAITLTQRSDEDC